MTATQARDYLVSAAQTEVGKEVLTDLGYGAIIKTPEKGDDKSTIKLAAILSRELHRRYPALFSGHVADQLVS
jgi:hypothetical protein